MLNISNPGFQITLFGLKWKIIRICYGKFLTSFPAHRHGRGFYEAHLICRGKGMLIIDEQRYALRKGSLYMTGPFVTHQQITNPDEPMEEYVLQFALCASRSSADNRAALLLKDTFFWIGKDRQNTSRLFRMMEEEYTQKALGYVQNLTGLCAQFLVALTRNYAGKEKSDVFFENTPDDQRMILTDEIFLYEYAVITLDALSQRLHLSPRQTQRFLKKSYGKTFVELRAERRRYNAQLLIAAGACPESAAEQVGYKDVRSLTR